jgi:tetratricopeptide (TPR) repeat protein
MAQVYRATDRATGEAVALKVLPSGSPHGPRFRREAAVLAALDHPHVVRYVAHGDGRDGEPAFIAMEWLEGTSLRDALDSGALSLTETIMLGVGVARALALAHAASVVHRDLKPENLFLPGGAPGAVKVLDFGVALVTGGRERMTQSGTPLGTIGYMAPEQVRGEADVDARADVFALGAVLFECLAGQPPFHADHALAVLAKITLEDAPRVRSLQPLVPPELDEMIATMLARDRADRPADAARVSDALASFGHQPTPVLSVRAPRVSSLTKRERAWLCAVVADSGASELTRTLALDDLDCRNAERRDQVVELGGRFEPLGAQGFVALFSGQGSPRALAERAARAAEQLTRASPDLALCVVAVQSSEEKRLPIARAVDGAARAMARGALGSILLDETTAGLLSARFTVTDGPSGPVLGRERSGPVTERLLLGKPTTLVGRQRELEALRAVLAECCETPVARAALLTGPAGIGKTRIHEKLATAATGLEVWAGRGESVGAGTPLAALGNLLRGGLGVPHAEPAATRTALDRAIATRVPVEDRARLGEFLGELMGLPPPALPSTELRAAHKDAILMGDQVRRAFEDLVCHVARRQPLLMIIDDLQWGDGPSWNLVDSALRRASELPVFVLGVGRPETDEAFPALWRWHDAQEVRVGPLPRRAATELARRALPGLDDALLSRLLDRAQGNPLVLEELLRAHADGRTDVPGSVLSMVQARLETLDAEGRRVLRAASVLGRFFWPSAVQALVGDVEPTRVRAWLAELCERELLVESAESRFAGQTELGFENELVREAAYASLTDEDRQLGHRLAAGWLEAAGERDARLLAEHHERGGVREGAAHWWQRAAQAALDANDFGAVASFAERSRAAGATGRLAGALLAMEAEALRWSGALGDALEKLDASLALSEPGTARWCQSVAERALLLQRTGKGDELPALAHSLLARSVKDGGNDPLAYASARAAQLCLLAGHAELAAKLGETVTHFSASGVELEPGTRAQVHVLRGLSAAFAGDFARYLAQELSARAAFEAAGDSRRALNEAGSIGFAQMELGRHREAEATLAAALAGAEALGLEHVKAASWHNLGLVYARLGRFDEARRNELRALDIFCAQGDRRLEGAARTYLAQIELLAGNHQDAARHAEAALSVVREAAPPIEPLALAVLAAARLALGDARAALDAAEAALVQVDAGTAEAGEALARLALAEALEALERHDEARAARATAKSALLARAARIEDPETRRSFLEEIAEHARTLAK